MKTVIGLTGTTGSGKSTVSQKFKECGFYVIDCDKLAKQVVENDKQIIARLCECFGNDIIEKGKLNRGLLASRAFANEKYTKALDAITLPAIVNEIKRIINDCDNKYILLDAPTLFESGANTLCQATVGVICDDIIREGRIIERDNLTAAQAKLRMSAQKSNDFFKENCTYIIENNADINSLNKNTDKIINLIIKG